MKQYFFFLTTILAVIFTGVGIFYVNNASANTGSFNPGFIISDDVFTNSSSMNAADIQSFLNQRNSVCLKDRQVLSLNDQNNDGLGDEPYGKDTGETVSAATLIHQAAQLYGINPQVILATLEKEQGLVNRTDCPEWRYNTALGYGCPDSEPCDDSAYGFTRQIDYGVWHFRGFFDDTFPVPPFTPGLNRIGFNPDGSCGSTELNIQNRATAALYSYTPYQPNAATLAAAPGQEVTCGAYGNLNFWRHFNQWFGSTLGVNVYSVRYDNSTDKQGEQARIGFGLSQRPTSDVRLSFYVDSPSNGRIVSANTLTITRDNWNKPEQNTITIAGLENANLVGNTIYSLKLSERPSSNDIRYRGLGSNSVSVSILHQDTNNSNAVYRLYNESTQKHRYTANFNERTSLIQAGWRNEGTPFSFCSAGQQTITLLTNSSNDEQLARQNSAEMRNLIANGFINNDKPLFTASNYGKIPVYWRYDAVLDRSLYTTSTTEGLSNGYVDRGVAFYACSQQKEPVFRLYKPNGSHFYTTSPVERDKAIYDLGYRNENLGFYACKGGVIPVHRFIKEENGVRFYTTSDREKTYVEDVLKYRYEGVGFRLCEGGETDVFRLYNDRTGFRLYTASTNERDGAQIANGYRYEGVGFKAE